MELLRKWFLDPALLLALVPFIKYGIEWLLRHVFGQTALHALELASDDNNAQEKVHEAVTNVEVRKALAQFVENATQLEEFTKVMVFASLSLLAWNLTTGSAPGWARLVNGFLIVATFLIILYLLVRFVTGKVAPGRKDATTKLIRLARALDFAILLFEATAIGLEHTQANS